MEAYRLMNATARTLRHKDREVRRAAVDRQGPEDYADMMNSEEERCR